MSGGHFDYKQYSLDYIADEIDQIIRTSKEVDHYQYTEETLKEFRKGLELIKEAAVYAQRIDWLVSGDDGEERFHVRLKEDLDKLQC